MTICVDWFGYDRLAAGSIPKIFADAEGNCRSLQVRERVVAHEWPAGKDGTNRPHASNIGRDGSAVGYPNRHPNERLIVVCVPILLLDNDSTSG